MRDPDFPQPPKTAFEDTKHPLNSRGFVAPIVAFVSIVLSQFSDAIAPAEQAVIVEAILQGFAALSALYGAFGRWRAKARLSWSA